MIHELLDYDGEEGNRPLTDWEIRFLDSIFTATVEPAILTDRQQKKLKEIWNAIFG